MSHIQSTRRGVLGAAAGLAAVGGIGIGRARAAEPALVSIIDAAGNLALTRPGFDAFGRANPDKVSRMIYTSSTAPEIPGKLMAQQAAGRVDIDLILGGNDVLAAGLTQNLWEPLFPNHASALPSLDVLSPMAKRLQGAADNKALIVTVCPGGPILEYMPNVVAKPPATAEALLDWAKQNPKKFLYARPANSGPGRAFMMGIPYILGDSNPKDPDKGWDKTWAYLRELGRYIEYYPGGTGPTMKELAEGTRYMIASHVGWDINPRVLGTVPKEARIATLQGFHWIADSHFMCVPKGLAPQKLALVLEMVNYMMQPAAQAFTFDKGYFYPGPARAGVTIDMAPKESQDAIAQYGRPEYAELIANNPIEQPLDAGPMVAAFQKWDQLVGANVGK
jgi:putative spermidine/putrescine transport system substrate-binding protein